MNVIPMDGYQMEGPQPLIREIPKGAEYPVEALGPLTEAVRAVADKTQAPIAIAGQSALSVASLAVQGLADVETLGGGDAPASLFCLTIARSGERKSGCDKLLMAGLREFEQAQGQAYGEAHAKAEAAIRLWKAKESRLIQEASGKGPKATEALADLDSLPPCPELPLSPNRTATDPTFEGLAKLYINSHPALGLFTDEGGAFFGGHAMNSENRLKTCAGLSCLWDGAAINRTRAGDGASTLWGRRLASHMMAQPVAVRPLLADPVASGQGFLARFLIAEPPSNIGYRTRLGYDPASDAALSRFSARLAELLAMEMPLKDGTRNQLEPGRISLSAKAKALLQHYYQATESAQKPGGDLCTITPYASKSAEQATRIAAVLTLWDAPGAVSVNADTMSNAITLAQYYLSEALRLADGAVISEKSEQAEALRRWLIENWKEPEILPADVARYGPASLRETAKATEVLRTLEKHGWVTALPAGAVVRGSARKLAFRIHKTEGGE